MIGGGPAGSTIATLLAREGWTVALLEKDRHPRFHIGESLLPHNLKIFRRLGVSDALERIGVYKPGVDFTPEDGSGEATEIRFDHALEIAEGCDHAYQVRRSELDRMLFEHACTSGALGRTGVRVRDVEMGNGEGPILHLEHDGATARMHARFVVDASGRDALLARKFGLQRRNRDHATAALYGHFRNVPRRPGVSAGNISIYWFDQGWIWMIPLPDGVMSVGAVCNPGYLRQRGGDVVGFFHDTLRRNPHAGARMAGAEAVSEITATGNYSYHSRVLDGPEWLMVGDAGVFVDPVFSSGVYFGMHSAESGAGVVDAVLRGDRRRAARGRRRFRRSVRRGVRELSWFIYRFPAPAMRRLFSAPSNVLGIEQAVISILAGDVYGNRRVWWRLRVFRLIYAWLSLCNLPRAWQARRQRMLNARTGFDRAA